MFILPPLFQQVSKMLIQYQSLFLSILILVQFSSPVKDRIGIMNNTVMIWTDNYLVAGIVVQALYKVIYVVCLRNVRSELLSDQLTAKLAPVSV